MTTPYRGYSEVPGGATPDVPYRVNLSLREIDADVQDLGRSLGEADAAQAGRLAALEAAAGFSGPPLDLQDQAVQALVQAPTSKTRLALAVAMGADLALTLAAPASALFKACQAIIRDHLATPWPGALAPWGVALQGQRTRAAVWVALGSSTTARAGATSAPFAYVNRLAARFGPLAVEALATATTRPAAGVKTYGGGISGAYSSNYLTAPLVAKIATLRPDLVTHMVGSNDWAASLSVATYETNMRSWLAKVRTASPGVVQVLIHQQARWDQPGGVTTWTEFGQVLAKLAAESPQDTVFLNIDQVWRTMGFPDGDYYGLMTADKIHVNNSGHAALAEQLGDFLGAPELALVPYETYQSDPIPTGSWGTVSKNLAKIKIPARPYVRTLTVGGAIYGTATAGIPDLYINPAGATEGIAAFRVNPGANSTHIVGGVWTVPAHTPVTLDLDTGPNGAGNVTLSTAGPAYQRFYCQLTPAQ